MLAFNRGCSGFRMRAPPSRNPLGRRRVLHLLLCLFVPHLLGGACASTANSSGVLGYQTSDGAWHLGGKGVVSPTPVELVPPSFPPDLRRPENAGQELLDIEVSREGEVARAEVVKSVSAASDAEALRTVKRWRYRPARIGNQSVAIRMRACVTFRVS